MEASNVLSIIALILSASTWLVLFLDYWRNKGRLELSAGVVVKENRMMIEIKVTNIGHRPITIVDGGYIEWALSGFSAGQNKMLFKTLREAETTDIYEDIQDISTIRRYVSFGVKDHNRKVWLISKENMHYLYDLSFGNERRDNKFNKLNPKSYAKQREKQLYSYLKFCKKYDIPNELRGKCGRFLGDEYLSDKIKREFEIGK